MDEAAALERLNGVLARSEFNQEAARSFWQILLDRLGNWIYDWLVTLGRPVGQVVEGNATWLSVLVLVVSLAAIALVLWLIARAIRLTVVGETLERRRDAQARRERSDALWQRAQQLAAEGRFAEAARDLYLSALYALEEHAVLRVQAGLTNREHALRVAGEHPELSAAFGSLVQRYDRLRYGAYTADAASFAELSGLADRARRLA